MSSRPFRTLKGYSPSGGRREIVVTEHLLDIGSIGLGTRAYEEPTNGSNWQGRKRPISIRGVGRSEWRKQSRNQFGREVGIVVGRVYVKSVSVSEGDDTGTVNYYVWRESLSQESTTNTPLIEWSNFPFTVRMSQNTSVIGPRTCVRVRSRDVGRTWVFTPDPWRGEQSVRETPK